MIKISVEGATTQELSSKLLEIGRLLAAEPVPAPSEGKPTRQRKAPAPTPAGTPPSAAAPVPGLALESGEFVPAPELAPALAPTPVVDSEAVRSELRAMLSGLVRAGKQPAVNELVTSYAPALSQVPVDKLPELKQKAEAL